MPTPGFQTPRHQWQGIIRSFCVSETECIQLVWEEHGNFPTIPGFSLSYCQAHCAWWEPKYNKTSTRDEAHWWLIQLSGWLLISAQVMISWMWGQAPHEDLCSQLGDCLLPLLSPPFCPYHTHALSLSLSQKWEMSKNRFKKRERERKLVVEWEWTHESQSSSFPMRKGSSRE